MRNSHLLVCWLLTIGASCAFAEKADLQTLIAAMRRYQDELSSWKPPERPAD